MLVLDSGGVSRLAERSTRTSDLISRFQQVGDWPPLVPSVVLVECLTGQTGRDANTNRLIKICDLRSTVTEQLARRAAYLRTRAGRGSAVDAIVVASGTPGTTVLTSDPEDLRALAEHAEGVAVRHV